MSEGAYYQAIEEFFVGKRGDPLFLSNADWVLVHGWRREGIPLRVVLRGIADAFEGRALSWSRDRKVGSLSYCRREVEAARDRWQHAVGGGFSAESTGERLLRLASQLEAAAARLPEPAQGLVVQAVRELRDLAGQAADRRRAESRLQAREAELVAALAEAAGPETVASQLASIERDLLPYRERMPASVLDQIRSESFARLLLQGAGLPRLSLLEP